MLLLGLPGTPFLYAGEELGLEDAVVPPERRVDPGNRDGCRAPIPWDESPGHGWSAEPWLPFPPDAALRSVAREERDPASMLRLYRRLLAVRRESPALRAGAFRLLDAPGDVLAWERSRGDDRRVCAVNFVGEPRDLPLEGRHRVLGSTTGREEGAVFDGRLSPDEGVVLRPESETRGS